MPFKYDCIIKDFFYFIPVGLNGKYGIVDFTGQEIVFPKYDKIEEIVPPEFPAPEKVARAELNGKYIYLNEEGKEFECKI